VPLVEASNAIDEKRGNERGVAIGLGNLADDQLKIGALAAAEESLRRGITLCQEIGDEFREAAGRQELGRLLAYTGAFEEAGRELTLGSVYFKKVGYAYDLARAYQALADLFTGKLDEALTNAMKAREDADAAGHVGRLERNIIRAEWLLGAAHRVRGELAQAEPHLEGALHRCRRINLIETEPNILLELARLRHAQAQEKVRRTSEVRRTWEAEALSLAREALEIADRCQYRLVQADCHNFLAELALEAGNHQKAQEHAETARERAWCDGPPHRYEAAFQEAERLLERIESLKH
jgi:tetratricopeptide (TPR) repeat protein